MVQCVQSLHANQSVTIEPIFYVYRDEVSSLAVTVIDMMTGLAHYNPTSLPIDHEYTTAGWHELKKEHYSFIRPSTSRVDRLLDVDKKAWFVSPTSPYFPPDEFEEIYIPEKHWAVVYSAYMLNQL